MRLRRLDGRQANVQGQPAAQRVRRRQRHTIALAIDDIGQGMAPVRKKLRPGQIVLFDEGDQGIGVDPDQGAIRHGKTGINSVAMIPQHIMGIGALINHGAPMVQGPGPRALVKKNMS